MASNWLQSVVADGGSTVFQSSQPQTAGLANTAMAAGTRYLQKQDYAHALQAFHQALAYQPDSTDAMMLVAKTYTFMNKPDDAIKAYQRVLRTDPTNTDAQMQLASVYMKSEKYEDARKEFQKVVAAQPTNSDAVISLGFVDLNTGRLDEAQEQFEKGARMSRGDANPRLGLGQVFMKMGQTDAAIDQFQDAVRLDRMNATAFSELGLAYVSKGDTALASQQADELQRIGTAQSLDLAGQLQLAMLTPKISFMDPVKSTFQLLGAPGTTVASLDPSLATPGASKVFSVSFVFNQAMDDSSVGDPLNWSISKATGGPGGVYNNGVTLHPGQETDILPMPLAVTYDPETHRATLYFRITQNAAGNGIIDPSHWVFRFTGTDAGGKPMDSAGDQFDGFALRPF
jgi:Tfp pilus assembly protein PilF